MKAKGLAALLCLALLAGCVPPAPTGSAQGETVYQVFFSAVQAGADGHAVSSEPRTISSEKDPVALLLDDLLGGPLSPELASPFPDHVSVLSWVVRDGVLQLDLSEQYGGLAGIDLAIADYCIVLTLCQIEEIGAVSITVEGESPPFRTRQLLRGSDVFLPTTADRLTYVAATLYFPTADLSALAGEQRDLLISGEKPLPFAMAAAVLAGPSQEDLRGLAPQGGELLAASVTDGVCEISLSRHFSDAAIAYAPEGGLFLYALVNSLCGIEGVEAVRLLIDGSPVGRFGGLSTAEPLTPDYDLVRSN